ncbi:MAG TPA: hypothetical protein VFL95_01785 [Gemmatimonadales bacterium]|nr:hypothetical protein [Gemmatimonadales bacterium]
MSPSYRLLLRLACTGCYVFGALLLGSKAAEYRIDPDASEDSGMGSALVHLRRQFDPHNYSAEGRRWMFASLRWRLVGLTVVVYLWVI